MAIAEEHLAEQLGLPRTRLRELRKEAPEGVEFPKLSNRIHWSGSAVAWLEKKLAAGGAEAKNGHPDANGAEIANPALIWVTLDTVYPRRKTWMKGREKKSGAAWRIHTRNNVFFTAGMVIPCLPSEWPGILRYYGPMPRARGRLHPKLIERYVQRIEGIRA